MAGPKSTQRFVGDNHIHYTSLRLLFLDYHVPVDINSHTGKQVLLLQYVSAILWVLTLCMWEKFLLLLLLWLVRGDSQLIVALLHDWFIPAPHIATQKASIGMYSGCDYPYKSYSCTFCPWHPYFVLLVVFIFVTVPFFIALWAKPSIHLFQQYHLAWFCPFNSQFIVN
jgi:hypothetical protein